MMGGEACQQARASCCSSAAAERGVVHSPHTTPHHPIHPPHMHAGTHQRLPPGRVHRPPRRSVHLPAAGAVSGSAAAMSCMHVCMYAAAASGGPGICLSVRVAVYQPALLRSVWMAEPARMRVLPPSHPRNPPTQSNVVVFCPLFSAAERDDRASQDAGAGAEHPPGRRPRGGRRPGSSHHQPRGWVLAGTL